MASVFNYTTRTGKSRYGVAYVRSDGARKYRRGFTSKRDAQRWGEQIDAREREYRDGLRTRDAESYIQHLNSPLENHIEAWLHDCELTQSAGHIKEKRRYLNNLRTDGPVLTLSSLSYDRVMGHLRRIRDTRSPRTYNATRAQIVAFARWCVKAGRLREHDLDRIPRLDEVAGRVKPRRALTRDEIDRFLNAAPPARRRIYLITIMTGLRRGELGRLLWDDIDMEHRLMLVRNTKAGRVDELPLHAQVVNALNELPRHGPRVFRSTPSMHDFNADLKRAGIRKVDDAGRVVDFHALRTTTGTMLARSGVTPQICKRLMRHSSMEITLRYYTDLNIRDDARALEGIEALGAQHLAQHSIPSRSATSAIGGGGGPVRTGPVASCNKLQTQSLTIHGSGEGPVGAELPSRPLWQGGEGQLRAARQTTMRYDGFPGGWADRDRSVSCGCERETELRLIGSSIVLIAVVAAVWLVLNSWVDLPPWLRVGAAVILLLISTGLYVAGTIWPWGWAVGAVMLVSSGPSDAEKKGYHF